MINVTQVTKKTKIFTSVLLTSLLGTTAVQAEEISISCGAVGLELKFCQEASEAWAEQTGNTVKIVSTPNSSSERLALYQQLLSAGAKDIDVFQVDVIWPGILGSHFIDLSQYSDGAEDMHFAPIIENNTVEGELKAMPWFTDAGLLYYRKDLLEANGIEVPTTWEGLTEAAKTIQEAERANGNDGFWGFVFQGKAYEGLTCNALEWMDAYGAGVIVDDEGEVVVNNDKARQALEIASTWVNNITPEGVLSYTEEEARGVFQSGNAAFMRNWPYAWPLANSEDSPIKGKVGVAALPKGGEDGKHTGTLGGWQLSVSKYSEKQEIAADLVMYLTSPEEQKRRAIGGAYNPTIASLYEDEEILAEAPFMGELYDTFTNAVARPSSVTGEKYNQFSNAYWNAVHQVLSGSASAEDSLEALESDLQRVKRRGW